VIDPETGKKTDALAWDVHFWLGEHTSIDERGVAAYKTVELDDLLDDGPVQHRELMGCESKLFMSYFKEIQYLSGGIESGFRSVKPEEYKPRLLQVRRTRKAVKAYELPDVKASALNQGDVFILDAGLAIYVWIGDEANAFEKSKGANLAHNIVGSRNGKARREEVDAQFWKILGGSESDVQPADHTEAPPDPELDPENCKMFRVSDASGATTFTLEQEGKLDYSKLDSNDAFIVDAGIEIFVWVGSKATKNERDSAFIMADKYIKDNQLNDHTPITKLKEGQINSVFRSVFVH